MRPESLSDFVLREALDAAPDGIVVVDEHGTIFFVNPMVSQLFDYRPEELVGMSVDILLPEAARAAHVGHRSEYAAHRRTRSMGTGLDLQGRRRSGDEFPIEISLSPLRAEEGPLVVAIIRDVTERRNADAELQRARETLALVDDRERIARDLHDTVIQRLFALGLSLQAVLTRVDPNAPERERLELAVDEIDVTIREIRSSIFALHTRRPLGRSLRDDVLSVGREAARALGFEPTVTFDGPIDTVVDDDIREQLLATLREALSNATRHAHASTVAVELIADADKVSLRVSDDGVGIQGRGEGSGLRNMTDRALAFGGACEIAARSDAGGTRIVWQVPVRDAQSG